MEVPPIALEDQSFDSILCLEMIEHIEVEKALVLLNECFRLLKPGGTLFLTTPNVANRGVMPPFHHVEYNVQDMQDKFVEAGFSIRHQGGMWLSTYKDRYKEGFFHDLRAKLYAVMNKDRKGGVLQGGDNKTGAVDAYTYSSKTVIRRLLRWSMVRLAKLIVWLGYIVPSKAEYQAWIVVKPR